jgi:hypothetical protein
MQTLGSKPSTSRQAGQVTNPLARALAETEQSLNRPQPPQADPLSSFNDTFSKTGGNFDFDSLNTNTDSIGNYSDLNNDAFSQYDKDQGQGNIFDQQAEQAKQQAEYERKQRLEAQRRKLHEQINPVNNSEIYDAKRERVTKAINELREELKGLSRDVKELDKTIVLATFNEVPDGGVEEGKGYIVFFQKLRSFIMLLRQKIKSANTWATQLHGKASKRKRKGSAGMSIGGAAHEKTSTVQDMMHHERSNSYSGG